MWNLSFDKYEGLGNDFLMIDDRQERFPIADKKFIQRLCHRKFGVGGDGVILLRNCRSADFEMKIFNADASEAESCGNGLRCLIRFIFDIGFPPKKYSIKIHDKIVRGELSNGLVAIDMGAPRDYRLHLNSDYGAIHFVNTGVPHVVHFSEDVSRVDLQKIGPILRRHPQFQPSGANVTLASLKQDGSFQVRTFERGVEEETLACGTGAVAVASLAQKLETPQKSYLLHFPGGSLEVREQKGAFWMIGDAKKVFSGSLEI